MRWVKVILKSIITCLVVGFVGWEFIRQWSNLPASAWNLDSRWLCLSGSIYIISFIPSLLYWSWCLHLLGQPTPKRAIFRAYYIGHLGKYVPGKALVPVLRAALLNPVRVQPAAAVLAVFYETLTCMAAGSFLVAVLLALWADTSGLAARLIEMAGWTYYVKEWPVWIAATGFCLLGLGMLLPLIPAGFNRFATWIMRRMGSETLVAMPGLSMEVLFVGVLVGIVNWALLGVSVWAGLNAIAPLAWNLSIGVRAIFSVSTAVVLGFVSMLPGGLGVREGVLALLLTQTALLSGPQASLAAVMLRLVWLIGEVMVAAGLLVPGGLKWLRERRLGRAVR